MSHPLQSRLAQIRRRVRQMLLVYGCSWLVAVVLGAVLVVGTADWLVHFDDPGVRLILGLCILCGGAWIGWERLVRPLITRLEDIDLALRLEARYPGFKDSFASTIEFLEHDTNPRIGSPALQRRVIAATMAQTARFNLDDVIQTRPVRRAALVAGTVCITAVLLAGLNQASAATALQRLMFPFSGPAWPKATSLQLVQGNLTPLTGNIEKPLRVSRGETLELYVINANNRNRLPTKVHFESRVPGGKVTSETLPRATLRNDEGITYEAAAITLNAKGPLEFRAVGGDDHDMPWYAIDVVPPPVIEEIEATVTPPEYTHQSPIRLPKGTGHVEGLIGTEVSLRARVNKRVGEGILRVKDQEYGKLEISGDGRTVTGSFTIAEAGVYAYWLDLKDEQGFENSDAPRYEIRGIQDTVPDIYIELPATDMQVVADADVAIRTVAKDDLGLRAIRLHYRLLRQAGDESHPQSIELFDGDGRPQQKTADYEWNLSDLKLAQGDRLVLVAEAFDDYDLVMPAGHEHGPVRLKRGEPSHVGRSLPRTLTIISREEKAQEIADRQTDVMADLERIAKAQSVAQEQVVDLKLQVEKAGALRPQDIDALQRVELQQRQIAGDLQNPSGGVAHRAKSLLEELDRNHIDDADARKRMERIADEIDTLGNERLPQIEQDLTQARKDAALDAEKGAPGSKSKPARTGTGKTSKPSRPSPEQPGKTDKSGEQTDTSTDEPKSPSIETRGEEPSKGEKSGETASENEKKAGPSQTKPAEGKAATLERAGENQAAVRDALQELVEDLAQWRDQRDVQREVGELISGETGLRDETSEIGKRTVGKPLRDLAPQDQADLARLAERQHKQAEQTEQLGDKLQKLINREQENNPAGAQALQEALDAIKQQGVAEQMEQAAQQIGSNKVGEASAAQQEVLRKLESLKSTLNRRPENDTETLVKQLKQAQQELANLRKQQSDLMQKGADAAQLPPQEQKAELERLQREQQQLREKTEDLLKRLRQSGAQQAEAAARRAQARMQQAEEDLGEGDTRTAGEQQQEALDDLEQAE
ncbi:MAG TPA: DUF4175 family protein, partial [Planctomycetaceae bacterium]|nr:DUF4175 family protein [Planctomycetaceae bacterium]